MNNDDAEKRTTRDLLTRLRTRRAAIIQTMAGSSLEGTEWLEAVAHLRSIQEALELVKAAQNEQAEYRPTYHGEK
jgi:hypothetical protein